jgi:hypothetical protein
MADKYLPDGLAHGKAKLKSAQAKMISTAGDANHRESRILISQPNTPSGIIALLRERI